MLSVAGLGALGLIGPSRFSLGSSARQPIKSCILIFYYGGPSHIDTWDMKPKAPKEVRGEFQSIATNVPGLRISEHLPRCAQVMDRLTVIRSMHHPMTNHNSAAFTTLSGRVPLKGDIDILGNDRNDPPCIGSTLSKRLIERPGIPTFVALPHVMHNVVTLPGQVAGFLGSAHNPFQIDRDPNATDFPHGELGLPPEISLDRLDDRAGLRKSLDRVTRQADASGSMEVYNEKAFNLLRSNRVRNAFQLGEEDPKLRDRYGRNKHGQGVLLARRMVEAGVSFVSVYDHQVNGQLVNWDSHADVFPRSKNDLLPPADQALAALIQDLSERGRLDETLVIAMGEFGRTPKVNASAGRDHWPYCYSVVMAGGGIQGGRMYGTSDKLGAYPDTDPVTPGDLVATLMWRFGLDSTEEIHDLSGRPYRLAEGSPIKPLFGA
jgi:hypothetical protein